MWSGRRKARVNIKLLVIVVLVLVTGVVGAFSLRTMHRSRNASAALSTAEAAVEARDWSKACKFLREYLHYEPSDAVRLKLYAEANLSVVPRRPENVFEAIQAYRGLLLREPGRADACHKLAELFSSISDFSESAYFCEQRLAVAPDDASARYMLADALFAQSEVARATDELHKLIAARPDYVKAYRLLAEVIGEVGNGESERDGLFWINAAVQRNPNSAEALTTRASYRLHQVGDRAGTETDLLAAERIGTQDPIVALTLADLWRRLGQLDRAEVCLQRAAGFTDERLESLEVTPAAFRLMKFMIAGGIVLARGDGQEASAFAERTLQSVPEHERFRYLPYALELFISGDQVARGRAVVEEYAAAIDIMGSTAPRALRHKLAMMGTVVARAEGRVYEAIAQLEELLIAEPRMLEAWRALWACLDETDQPVRRSAALHAYLMRYPNDTHALTLLGQAYRGTDWPRVLQCVRNIKADQRSVDVTLLGIEAELALVNSVSDLPRLAEIDRLLDRLERVHPRLGRVRVLRAGVALREGRSSAALDMLRTALEVCDPDPVIDITLAGQLARDEEIDEAHDVLDHATRRFADDVSVWIALARFYDARDERPRALAVCRQAAGILSGSARVKLLMAQASMLLEDGNREEAIDLLQSASAAHPHDTAVRVALLELPEIQADVMRSQAIVDELQRIEGPSGLRWRLEQAMLWLRSDEWSDHAAAIEESMLFCAQKSRLWAAPIIGIGLLEEKRGHDDRAEQIYKGYVAGRPQDIEVVVALLRLFERRQQFQDADELLDRLPATPELMGYRINVAMAIEDHPTAITQLRRILNIDPGDVTARVLLARLLYEHEGNAPEALALLDEVSADHPEQLSVVASRAAVLHAMGRPEEALQLINGYVDTQQDFAAYALRAAHYAEIGESDLAEADYRRLTSFSQDKASGYYQLGGFLVRAGRKAEAVEVWREGLAAVPQDIQLQRTLARVLVNSHDAALMSEGRQLIATMLENTPADGDLMFLKAAAAHRDGADSAEVEALLRQAVDLDVRHVAAHRMLVNLLRHRGDYETARQDVAQAVGLNPADTGLRLLTAELEAAVGNRAAARGLAESVVDQDPDNISARQLLAKLALHDGKFDECRTYLEDIVKQAPEDVVANLLLAELTARTIGPGEAATILEPLADGEDRRVDVLVALADYYRVQGQHDRAGVTLDRAERVLPNHPQVIEQRIRWLGAGQRFADILSVCEGKEARSCTPMHRVIAASMLATSGQPAYEMQARTLFENTLKVHPDLVDAHLGLAMLAYREQDFATAEREYEIVRTLRPYDRQALNDLAWLIGVERGRHIEALRLADQGIGRYPNDPHLRDTRGVLLMKMDRLEDARKDLEHCLSLTALQPHTQASALIHLAEVAVRQKRPDEAREFIARALRLDILSATQRKTIKGLESAL